MSDERFEKIRKIIGGIDSLENINSWGPEFQLWKESAEREVRQQFGQKGLNLFQQQGSVVISREGYLHELENRRKILKGLVEHAHEYSPDSISNTPSSASKPKTGDIDWGKWGTIGTYVGIIVAIIIALVGWLAFTQKPTDDQPSPGSTEVR